MAGENASRALGLELRHIRNADDALFARRLAWHSKSLLVLTFRGASRPGVLDRGIVHLLCLCDLEPCPGQLSTDAGLETANCGVRLERKYVRGVDLGLGLVHIRLLEHDACNKVHDLHLCTDLFENGGIHG